MSTSARGMTLLETIVAIVILGVLSTLAVVTFGGVGDKTRDEKAKQVAEGAVAAELSYEQTRGSFTVDPFDLADSQSDTTYLPGTSASDGPTKVSIAVGNVGTESVVGVAVLSESGRCFTLRSANRESSLQDGHGEFDPVPGQPCTGSQAIYETKTSW